MVQFSDILALRDETVQAAGRLRDAIKQWAEEHDVEENLDNMSISEVVKLVKYYEAIRNI